MHALADRDVVLLGIGHTNAHVLRMWRMKPPPGGRLTCVSSYPVGTYSGMLPGVLAGEYPQEQMEIDLVRLCAAAGARLVIDEVCGLDRARQALLFADRAPVPFDVLSIGIGSVPTYRNVAVIDGTRLVPVKPMQTFLERLDDRLRQAVDERRGSALRVAIVGGGAGGVELALCLPAHLRMRMSDQPRIEHTLISADEELLPGSAEGTARRVERILTQRGVRMVTGRRVTHVDGGQLAFDDGTVIDADLILWLTGAAAPPLLATLGLPTDARGFLLTADTLQTTAGDPIFAVGDTGTIEGLPTPKAGVFAVRQGPVLWENIARTLAGGTLESYRPQRGFLKLLNTGDGRAIGEWKGVSFEGAWCGRLKHGIDSRFMRMYQDYTPMRMSHGDITTSATGMRCAGCGGKVGASVLSRALARLDVPPSAHVLLGLAASDDAAVVVPPGGHPLAVTVDFFAAPFDDAYLVGRIAALNATSDIFAIGAVPFGALAAVTLPIGQARQQEALLYELLAGSLHEFRKMPATLIGGHTIEGPQLTVGFTILGSLTIGAPRTKAGLRAGDQLVLTKPLGTGVLLAAHMRARCRWRWFGPLVASLLVSNGPAAACLDEFEVAGLTDVTGFGLAGHLLESLRASHVAARLRLAAIPLLPGVVELIGEGLESTLAPSNREVEAEIESGPEATGPSYQVLFDPQTCGGLIMGVPPAHVRGLIERLTSLGYPQACVIGEVVPASADGRRIRLV